MCVCVCVCVCVWNHGSKAAETTPSVVVFLQEGGGYFIRSKVIRGCKVAETTTCIMVTMEMFLQGKGGGVTLLATFTCAGHTHSRLEPCLILLFLSKPLLSEGVSIKFWDYFHNTGEDR